MSPSKQQKEIKIVEASGSYYDIGLQVGRATKNQILAYLETTTRATHQSEQLQKKYAAYLPYLLCYPNIRDEIQGMADGAGLDFETLAKLNIVELESDLEPDRQCSTFYVEHNGQPIVGHNEDGREQDDIFILKASYPSGISILSLCYFARLPGFSANINSQGLVITCNALHSNDRATGIPKIIFARLLLECESIESMIALLGENNRAQGQHLLVVGPQQTVSIEVSASDYQLIRVTGNFYHCNNYRLAKMQAFEAGDVDAKNGLRNKAGERIYQSLTTMEDIRRTLSLHDNEPFSFCGHGDAELGGLKTLGSFYVDFSRREIWVGYGPSCTADLQRIKFESPITI